MSKEKPKSFLNNWAQVGSPDSGIVREAVTGREGQRRIIALDPLYDPKNEQWIYNYRRDTHSPFVQAYGSEILKLEKPPKTKEKTKTKEAKDPYNHLAVITERIPHRLSESPQLTYPETLYVLDRALEGYEVAYQKVGPLKVNDQMIGFNNEGHCKVWVNEDFANNHPSYPRRRLISTRINSRQYLQGRFDSNPPVANQQSEMVQDVVNTVENYCQQGRFPEPFTSQIHQNNLSFGQARRILHNRIAVDRIPVPNHVDLFNNKVRGYRTTTTTNVQYPLVQQFYNHQTSGQNAYQHTVGQNVLVQPAVQQVVKNAVQNQVLIERPVQQFVNVATHATNANNAYRFNYLPTNNNDRPAIYASQVRY